MILSPGHVDITGRVVEDVIVPGQPLEEGPDRGETHLLGADCERLSGNLAIVEQIPLIPFDHGFGDLVGTKQSTLRAPGQEVTQIGPAVLHSPLRVVGHLHPFIELVRQDGHGFR